MYINKISELIIIANHLVKVLQMQSITPTNLYRKTADIHTRIDPDIRQRLDNQRIKHRTTTSNLVREFIHRGLDELEQKHRMFG
ncbi:MAG: hypothetical protein CMK29_08410 [Porticoccaceae bacterium]|nr:hypothetical protein [Porticoccaceae bacterium]